MLNVQNLSQKQKEGNTTLSMIVYGDSGVGKTTLAATSVELGKVLYIDAEAGTKFIADKYAKNIDILKLEDVGVLDEVLKPENVKEYQTIVLDSVTEIMKKLLDKAKGNKDRANIGDWGLVITGMETYFRRFRDLDKNIILVALSSEKEDEDKLVKRPSLSGKNLPADLVGYMDVCIYLEMTANGRVGNTKPSQKFYAKDRTNKLPAIIEEKNLRVKYLFDLVTVAPQPATKETIERIKEKIGKLKLSEEGIGKALEFVKAKSFEKLDANQSNRLEKVLDKKIELAGSTIKPGDGVATKPELSKTEKPAAKKPNAKK